MNHVVEVNGLTKTYGKFKAVNQVSFKLVENRIYGLLGRNGAGKTTIMHMLTAQILKTSGDVKVFGEEPYENVAVLDRICFIKESQKYPENFNVRNVLDTAASFYPNWDSELANKLVKEFDLPLKLKTKKLSRGMLSSVGIIIGLASRAPLTIFDEPYLGLDAASRQLFYNRLIEDYMEHPRTIILSTHLIDEVSQLLEHVLLIDKGKLILDEDADQIRGKAVCLVGQASIVDTFTSGKQILDRKAIGSLVSVNILGPLSGNDRKKAEELGIEFAPVSLQQLFVHLTNNTQVEKEGAR